MNYNQKTRTTSNIILSIFMLLITLTWFVPIVIVFLNSIKSDDEILRNPFAMPESFKIGNYVTAFVRGNFQVAYLNSVLIAAVSTIVLIFVCSAVSFPLERRKNKFNSIVYFVFLAGLMVPTGLNLVPNYKLFKILGLLNSPLVVICVDVVLYLPFTCFLYTGFMKTIPREIDEAALMDGCSQYYLFFKIIFPLLKPVTAAAVILNCVPIFNDFTTPLFYASQIQTVTLGLYNFKGVFFHDEWNYLFAGVAIVMVAPIIVFLMFQKFFEKGLVAGSVKG